MTDFFRFPRIPHIAWFGEGEPRDDKVLSPAEARSILSANVVVEEKIDGANLGLSVGANGSVLAQSRGQYLRPPLSGQFARLGPWLAARKEALFDALDAHLIAFGEWCTARHSLEYTTLPDWWLVFDIYDRREGRFWSTNRRDDWARGLSLPVVPTLLRGHTDLAELIDLLDKKCSHFRNGPMEGVVIRMEEDRWLNKRAKLVRAEFSQQIESHWRDRSLVWNHLKRTA